MKIYNTLTRNIEQFIPRDKDNVTMYTCGPTVYHYAHIENIRTYIMEDILEKNSGSDVLLLYNWSFVNDDNHFYKLGKING